MKDPRYRGEAAGTGADNNGGASSARMVPALDLEHSAIEQGVEHAAAVALRTGTPAVLIGKIGDTFVVCDDFTCCGKTPRALVVADDLFLTEIVANGDDLSIEPGAWTLERADGRRVYIFAVTGGGDDE